MQSAAAAAEAAVVVASHAAMHEVRLACEHRCTLEYNGLPCCDHIVPSSAWRRRRSPIASQNSLILTSNRLFEQTAHRTLAATDVCNAPGCPETPTVVWL